MVPTCPPGMVLIDRGGPVHPDEPAYCIMETEVTQSADRDFWAARQKSGFELVVTKNDGSEEKTAKPKEKPLRTQAAAEIQKSDVAEVSVLPVVAEDKRQPDGNLAGPNKPAMYRNWGDARTYCQSVYPGGDLPTGRQWAKACGVHGDREYCTASGIGSRLKEEADYDRSWGSGPKDVDAFPPNPNGVRNMSGGVWEWTLDDSGDYKIIRGGSWYSRAWYLRADFRGDDRPGYGSFNLGFRCVAPPQGS